MKHIDFTYLKRYSLQWLLVIVMLLALTTSCGKKTKEVRHSHTGAMKIDETYVVWKSSERYGFDEEGFRVVKEGVGQCDTSFIRLLPRPVKSVIAWYALCIPDSMWRKEEHLALVRSLGNFSSLEDAFRTLSQNSEINFPIPEFTPFSLSIQETDSSLIVEYYTKWGILSGYDEYRINKKGDVVNINIPESDLFSKTVDELPDSLFLEIEALKNDITYEVWSSTHSSYVDTNTGKYGEDDDLEIQTQRVRLLPRTVQAIITYYASQIPDYVYDERSSRQLAEAMGTKSSWKNAQKVLLQDWEQWVSEADKERLAHAVRSCYYPAHLKVWRHNKSVIFIYSEVWGHKILFDEFKISRDNRIHFIGRLKEVNCGL